jgi:hypothetical protein
MSVIRRSRWAVRSALAAVPAILLVSACSSSTAPGASAMVDTVAVNPNSVVISRYTSSSASGYNTQTSTNAGDYVQVYSDGSYSSDYREVVQYALPALRGRRIVDSATVFEYVCTTYASNSHVTTGPRAAAAARRLADAGNRVATRDARPAIMLDHISFAGGYADSTAWGADVMGPSTTLIAASDSSLGWTTVSVTSGVQADYAAGHANSQYRIRYASNTGGYYYTYFGGYNCQNSGLAGDSYLVIWSH